MFLWMSSNIKPFSVLWLYLDCGYPYRIEVILIEFCSAVRHVHNAPSGSFGLNVIIANKYHG